MEGKCATRVVLGVGLVLQHFSVGVALSRDGVAHSGGSEEMDRGSKKVLRRNS